MMITNQSNYLFTVMRSIVGYSITLLLLVFTGCTQAGEDSDLESGTAIIPETAVETDDQGGWVTLFDGETLDGWRGLGQDGIPEGHWIAEDGAMRKVASDDVARAEDGQPIAGGDLLYDQQFSNFEFSFEWKVSPGANSGIKYNVSEEFSAMHPPSSAALGFEYQVLDNELHADAKNDPNRWAGGLYDLIPPLSDAELSPVGEWNTGKIVFDGNRGEHWLNGVKTVEYELGTHMMNRLFATSKWGELGEEGNHIPDFDERRDSGYIVLQDHGDDVWYRNLRIREL